MPEPQDRLSVLVTAFEPFGGADLNASAEVARRVAALDARVTVALLPVVRETAPALALEAFRRMDPRPALMLSLGEGPKTMPVSLEKVAINWDDYRIADNAGNRPRDEPIVPGGPDAYFASLPVATIARDLTGRTPVPIAVSLSAGAFLCNHVAYRLLDARLGVPYAFVHVPASRPHGHPEAGGPSLDALAETVASVIAASIETLGV